jgi:hypothetical protein
MIVVELTLYGIAAYLTGSTAVEIVNFFLK